MAEFNFVFRSVVSTIFRVLRLAVFYGAPEGTSRPRAGPPPHPAINGILAKAPRSSKITLKENLALEPHPLVAKWRANH